LHVNKIFVVVVLLLATVALFRGVQRYEPVGPELLGNGDFKAGLEGWSVRGDEIAVETDQGTLAVENSDPSRSVEVRQTIPAPSNQRTWLLSAEITTENVVPGVKSWHRARVILVGRSAEGKNLWGIKHVLEHLTGSTVWRGYSSVFRIPDNATEAVMAVQLLRATGVIRVRNIRLTPVGERTGFRLVAYVLLALWTIALAWIGGSLFISTKSKFSSGMAALVTMAIAAGALMPGTLKQEFLEFAWAEYGELRSALLAGIGRAEGLTWGEPEFFHVNSSQIGHFSLFFVLALLMRFARWKDRGVYQFMGLLLFGAIIEVLQFYVLDRQPTLIDWAFDSGGIIFAFIVSALLALISGKSRAEAIDHGDVKGSPS